MILQLQKGKLHADEQKFKTFLSYFNVDSFRNDHMRFFCFQVIEHYLKTGYKGSTIADHNAIKTLLLGWLELQVKFVIVCIWNHLMDRKLFLWKIMMDTISKYLWFVIFQCVGPNRDKNFVRNKAAQMFALACTVDYPQRWPTFFNDLLQTLHLGEVAVDIYLRILKAIDSEVVDREITHTQEVREKIIRWHGKGNVCKFV